jgi:hypothetical protein
MVALDGASKALAPERYLELLKRTGFSPDAQWLSEKTPLPERESVVGQPVPAPSSA